MRDIWGLRCALGVCGIVMLGVPAGIAANFAAPVFSNTGPDAAEYGAAQGYPVGSPGLWSESNQSIVGTYSHFDQVFPGRLVAHAATPWSFRRAPAEPEIVYSFQDHRYTIDDYLHRNPTTGLLIARDDTILYEHYQYARTDHDRFVSQSMAKTIVSMLVGIAVSEGAIKSIDDDVAKYVPELAETEYGKTSIRALLHMSSGVKFSERGQDIAHLVGDLLSGRRGNAVAVVKQFNTRLAAPGAVWHYASVETEVLGLVLRAATGKPAGDYLRDRIWQRIGTESDASWVMDTNGQELTFCCFNAVLRDYARFGRLLANNGTWENRQVIPRQWILDATTVRSDDPSISPGTGFNGLGYGYQVWLLPGTQRRFVLVGYRGQMLFVDPGSKLVMVHTAVRQPDDPFAETIALWSGIEQQLVREGFKY